RRQGLADSGNRFHYYRPTADGRILWGGWDALYHWRNRVGPDLEQDDRTSLSPASGSPTGGAGPSPPPPGSCSPPAPATAARRRGRWATPASGSAPPASAPGSPSTCWPAPPPTAPGSPPCAGRPSRCRPSACGGRPPRPP